MTTWTPDGDAFVAEATHGRKTRRYTLRQLDGGPLHGRWLLAAHTPGGKVKGHASPGAVELDAGQAQAWASGVVEGEWTDGTRGLDYEGLAACVGGPERVELPVGQPVTVDLHVYGGVKVSQVDVNAPVWVEATADPAGPSVTLTALPGFPGAAGPCGVHTDEGAVALYLTSTAG